MADANSKKPMALLLLVVVAVLVVIIMSDTPDKVTGKCTKITGTCSELNITNEQGCIDEDHTWTPKTEEVNAKDKDDCKTNGGEWAYSAATEDECKKIDKATWHPEECSDNTLTKKECSDKQKKWSKAVCK